MKRQSLAMAILVSLAPGAWAADAGTTGATTGTAATSSAATPQNATTMTPSSTQASTASSGNTPSNTGTTTAGTGASGTVGTTTAGATQATTPVTTAGATQAPTMGQTTPTQNVQWLDIGKGLKDFSQQELQHHFDGARAAYVMNNYEQAANELAKARGHLELQQAAILSAENRLDQLIGQTRSGSLGSAQEIDKAQQMVANLQDRLQTSIPVTEQAAQALKTEPSYHLQEARSLFAQKKFVDSSQAVDTAVTYLKMQGALSDATRKAELDGVVQRLSKISSDLRSGSLKTVKPLDQAAQAADRALRQG